jgi:Zn-dependent peptidase ImmA (M78 family)
MKSVIAAMLLWIGANTNYDVNLHHPEVQIVPQAQLEQIYSKGKGIDKNSELHAFYDTKKDTIYLPESFDLYNAWHKGVLLHELLHYVQDQNQVEFECSAQMEAEAWPLQKKYLHEVHGVDWQYDDLWFRLVSSCSYGY